MFLSTAKLIPVGNTSDGLTDNLPGSPWVEAGVLFLHQLPGEEEDCQGGTQRETERTIQVGRDAEEITR